MAASLFGYFFGMITVLTAAVVLLTGLSNISTMGSGRHHPPVISRTVVEAQRHLPVAKEEAPAKDASPVVATAKADTKKIKHYKPKVLARQRNNYGYGHAMGYAGGFFPLILLTGEPAIHPALVCWSFAQHATTMFFSHFVGDACAREQHQFGQGCIGPTGSTRQRGNQAAHAPSG